MSIEASIDQETLDELTHNFFRYLQRGIGDNSPLEKVMRTTGETDERKALNLALKEYARRNNTQESSESTGRFIVLPVSKDFSHVQIEEYEDDWDKFLIIDLESGYYL